MLSEQATEGSLGEVSLHVALFWPTQPSERPLERPQRIRQPLGQQCLLSFKLQQGPAAKAPGVLGAMERDPGIRNNEA